MPSLTSFAPLLGLFGGVVCTESIAYEYIHHTVRVECVTLNVSHSHTKSFKTIGKKWVRFITYRRAAGH